MKYMKKLSCILLALVLVLSMSTMALATQEGTLTGGSITIDNAVVGQTYNAYQILYLESYNATSGAYAYKANSAWETWLKTQTTYVSIDDQGYVTWVKDADAAAFAKAAQAYATTTKAEGGVTVSPDATATATATTVKFENLNLGYYLVDSTLGTLCSLDTTNPSVTIKEKNGAPTLNKEVEEDSTGAWGGTNDADIGQTVNFKATINVIDGQPKNYVMHDTMSAGLTFVKNSVKVTVNGTESNAYTLVEETNDGCTFEIQFTDPKPNDEIVVTYSATVNSGAVIGMDGNTNKAKLSYTDTNETSHNTPEVETKTYTWDLDVLKYANGDESKVLKDAQFVLLNSDKTKVATVVNGKLTGWADVPAAGTDGTITWPANTVLTTNENGKIEIDGLDADTYYLREIKAPDGYNKLAEDVKVEITGATKGDNDTLTYTTAVAKVNNQSGTELPSTGGMGTTIFYVLGSILVLAAVVLLVTKKRMGNENA